MLRRGGSVPGGAWPWFGTSELWEQSSSRSPSPPVSNRKPPWAQGCSPRLLPSPMPVLYQMLSAFPIQFWCENGTSLLLDQALGAGSLRRAPLATKGTIKLIFYQMVSTWGLSVLAATGTHCSPNRKPILPRFVVPADVLSVLQEEDAISQSGPR